MIPQRKVYRHPPGIYSVEVSPRGNTFYITKNGESGTEKTVIYLTPTIQHLYQQKQNLGKKDIHDQSNQEFCNKS